MKYLVGLLALFVAHTAFAQNIGGPPYIAVHGQAKIEVVPDIFPLDITLKEASKDTAAAQGRIESLAQDIVDLAKAQNIPDADVNVGNLSVSPETDYDEKTEKQIFLGNNYEREIKISFRTLDGLRQFLSRVPQAKQIRIDTGSFGYSNSVTAKKKLMSDAIADARATADELAKGVGKRIAGVHTISNQGFNVRYAESVELDTVTVQGVALLAPGSVVLKEGRITLAQDVYIIYLIAD
jgi:uncharacterized protein YggE